MGGGGIDNDIIPLGQTVQTDPVRRHRDIGQGMPHPGKKPVGLVVQRIFYSQRGFIRQDVGEHPQQIVTAGANDDLFRTALDASGPIKICCHSLLKARVPLWWCAEQQVLVILIKAVFHKPPPDSKGKLLSAMPEGEKSISQMGWETCSLGQDAWEEGMDGAA